MGAITALAFSPDGKQVALGAYGQVVLYDTATWKPTGEFYQIADSARALAFSQDGRRLAIGCGLPSRSGETLLWDLNPASKPIQLRGQKDAVEAVAFNPAGTALLAGSDDNTARCYTTPANNSFVNLDEHNGRVQAVAFSPKNGWIYITGGLDHMVKVWDPASNHTVVNFDQSEDGITGLAFLPNGSQFVGSSLDGKLYWWGVNHDDKKQTYSGYQFRVEKAHEGGVYGLSPSGDGKRFITCGADSTVSVWNIGGGKIRTFSDAKQPIYAVALSPDGKTALGGGRDGVLYIWDVDGNKLLNTLVPPALPIPPKPVKKPDQHRVAAAHAGSSRGR